MRVLVACEFSGTVRDAFLARGHDAWSCDIMAGVGKRHIRGDVTKYLKEAWDLVIAHPPCTYISNLNSGLLSKKHPQRRAERLMEMFPAVEFFLCCLNANSPKIAVENPIPCPEALKLIGIKYSQIIQPWQYGHPYSKATCLWLKSLPLLVPTKIVHPTMRLVATGGNNLIAKPKVRVAKSVYGSGRMHSIFHVGVAKAMAEQWGILGEVG